MKRAMRDPRTELVQKLKEYKQFKAISAMLEERREEALKALEKPQEDLAEYTGEPDIYLSLDIEQFKNAFELFIQRKKRLEELREHHLRTEKQRITTELRMIGIRDYFKNEGLRETDFRKLVPNQGDKYDISVTFASVLEMMKARTLDAEQKKIFGDIKVKATDRLFEDIIELKEN